MLVENVLKISFYEMLRVNYHTVYLTNKTWLNNNVLCAEFCFINYNLNRNGPTRRKKRDRGGVSVAVNTNVCCELCPWRCRGQIDVFFGRYVVCKYVYEKTLIFYESRPFTRVVRIYLSGLGPRNRPRTMIVPDDVVVVQNAGRGRDTGEIRAN